MSEEIKDGFDMSEDCMVCGKKIGFRGFCSKKCHDEHYDYLIGELKNEKI